MLEALESAEDAGLITADPREPLRFSFVHALFRTVRYDSMRASTRLRLHGAIAAVLRPRADDERVLPLLAHHACAAAPLGDAEDAVMLARRAGHLARRRRGYDEAAEQYERALALLDLVPSAAASRLGLLLRVDLATALFDGGRPAGRPLLQAAIEEAREQADDEALANATSALSGITGGSLFGGRVDHDIAAMFSEALDRVPPEPSPLRARLLIGLSGRLADEDVLRARELARAAIDMAGGLGDLSAVGDGLMTYRWLIFEPAMASERVAVGEELIALGRRLDDPKFTTGGLSQLLQVRREAGDLVAAARVQADFEALSTLRPHPVTQMIVIGYQATERYLAGDLAGAEATAETLLNFGSESGVDSFNGYALLLGAIRSEQGRFGELLPFIEQAVAEQPNHRGYVAALARALARVGRLDEAADVLRGLAVHNYDMPHNVNWFIGTEQLADAVEILGDTAVAAILRERLTPFAGSIVNFAAWSQPPHRSGARPTGTGAGRPGRSRGGCDSGRRSQPHSQDTNIPRPRARATRHGEAPRRCAGARDPAARQGGAADRRRYRRPPDQPGDRPLRSGAGPLGPGSFRVPGVAVAAVVEASGSGPGRARRTANADTTMTADSVHRARSRHDARTRAPDMHGGAGRSVRKVMPVLAHPESRVAVPKPARPTPRGPRRLAFAMARAAVTRAIWS